MKLLVDESLQHELARILTKAGHDAVHVTDLDLNGAADDDVLTAAAATGRIVVTADTDFGTLLALSNAAGPSVILLRRPGRRAPERAQTILTVLELVAEQLISGSVITVEGSRLRIRQLPIRPESGIGGSARDRQ